MTRFDPKELEAWSNGIWLKETEPRSVSSFCFDARRIRTGECFVALSGGERDGHDFVAQAVAGGASALLVEHPQNAPIPQLVVDDSLVAMGMIAANVRANFSHPVIGITGSCGKTSTKEMLRVLLDEARTHATAGNWNNRIGVPMTLFGLDQDAHDFAVIEAGINQPGEMSELGEMIHADLTVVTNIAPAHLELLGSLANVAAEKAQLQLCARDNARVILPASLLQYPAYLACADRAIVVAAEDESVIGDPQRVIRYRLDATAPTHTILYLTDDSGTEHFQVASTSRGICVNAALAIVAARELCITDSLIRDRLARWLPNSDRGGMVTRGRQSFYIDCYNANPSSMTDAIAAYNRAAPTGAGRCYILGAMDELGSDAEVLHQEVGQQLVLGPHDRVLFVGPQALTQAYTVGALEAGCSSDQLQCVSDVEKIKSIVAEFKGSLFLKGSRSYALEQLLPAEFR